MMPDYKIEKHEKQWRNAIEQLEKRGLLKREYILHQDSMMLFNEMMKSDYDIEKQKFQMNPQTFINMGGDINNVPDHIELIY